MQEQPIRIAMWSGPRALSTAMMRAWENRPDCIVVDEPLYGAYLAETGLDHPIRDEIIATMECDAAKAGSAMAALEGAPVIYQKHMTHHLLPSMPRTWIDGLRNAFLIRRPEKVLASYDQKRPAPSLADIGIAQQAELFQRMRALDGKPPPVIDADDLQAAPVAMLRRLCAALAVPFDAAMLAWPAGRRESDGIWASHWYDSVWTSTGFAPPRERQMVLSPALKALASEAMPLYEILAQHRLTSPC
jgi:hypothetical protein